MNDTGIYTVVDTMMGENCYVLPKDGKAVIIDPGLDNKAIQSQISNLKLQINYILLTHGHYDHIDSLRYFRDVPVYAHIDEKQMLEDPAINMSFYTGEPFSAKGVNYYSGKIHKFDGFIFIHAPGHTKGGVLIKYGNDVFTGDTLFMDTVGRTDTPTGDANELKETLKMFSSMDGELMMYPGHGEPFKLIEAFQYNYFLRR